MSEEKSELNLDENQESSDNRVNQNQLNRVNPMSQGNQTNEANETSQVNGSKKDRRGFASMDRQKQREIASRGGKAAHGKGTAHEFTSQEAREAGRKGGEKVSQNREHMSRIGRKGGESRTQG